MEYAGQGSNSAVLRAFNQRVILTALRRLGEASKAELARQVNLTQNAAGQIVKGLESRNLVRMTGKRSGLRGQPATLLQLDPGGAYSIGVKLGRRSIDSLLVDFSGAVLKTRRTERPLAMPAQVLGVVRNDIAMLRRMIRPDARGRLAGVGLALPYNLGSWRRELDLPEAICDAWNEYDLAAQLRTMLDIPVLVENDGTAVAVAELFGGCGRELDDFAVVYLGAAVGGGLVLGGDFRRGVTGNAGDIGLMPVQPSRLSSAPRPERPTEILLARASVNALVRHLRAGGAAAGSAAEIAQAIEQHPGLVAEWLDDCADALVHPLLSIASLLDLQAIVIDGALPRAVLTRLIGMLEERLAATMPEARSAPVLRLGRNGSIAAALGAATLPLHSDFGTDRDRLFGA